MRRPLLAFATGLTAAALLLVPGTLAASPARPTTASNRQLAIKDARRTLDEVVAPAGAKLISSGAASGHGAWNRLIIEAFDSAIAYRTWTVPGDISSVMSAVRSHLPKGLTLTGIVKGSPPQESMVYSRPPVNGKLGVRYLEILVSRKSASSVTLLAQAQSQYIVTRTAAQLVPASARVVDLVSQSTEGQTIVSRVVTKSGQVNALVRLFNSVPGEQPGIGTSCPALTAEPMVTVVFRQARGAPVLAGARGDADANFSWPNGGNGWSCYATNFGVRGHPAQSLAGNIDGPIQRILDLSLTG
jgi:hypothetical protein